ncbi:uncharacterized protein TNCV_661511 [Trichonephila clavipes]|nr:uncharacterized protein TNCV_661511 [Trichonephila clavipes]
MKSTTWLRLKKVHARTGPTTTDENHQACKRATIPQIAADFNIGPPTGRQHRQWSVDDWKHVAWSDESRFQLNKADGWVQVWRQSDESMDPTCQQGIVQAGGNSVSLWGVGSWRDMEPLICLNATLIGTRTMRHPLSPELLQRGSRSTLLNLDTFAGHQNPQT